MPVGCGPEPRALACTVSSWLYLRALTPPAATAFWGGLADATTSVAQRARMIYTGNGQAYNLYILYYFIFLYAVAGGIRFALIN